MRLFLLPVGVLYDAGDVFGVVRGREDIHVFAEQFKFSADEFAAEHGLAPAGDYPVIVGEFIIIVLIPRAAHVFRDEGIVPEAGGRPIDIVGGRALRSAPDYVCAFSSALSAPVRPAAERKGKTERTYEGKCEQNYLFHFTDRYCMAQ